MFEKVLQDLGVTQESVRGAIKGLLDSSPELKAQVREIVGTSTEFEKVGFVGGQNIYARRT